MPIGRAIVTGIVTSAFVGGFALRLLVGQIAGPIDFSLPLLLVAGLGLILTALISRPNGWGRGIFVGLGFSLPVAITCFTFHNLDPEHLRAHVGQLRFVGILILLLSGVVMAIRGDKRITPHGDPV
jgi:hypothetical protein